MERGEGFSTAYEEALRLAVVAHRQQKRKGNGLPYIIHPIHVSVILLRHGFSTEAAIAGLLHDVVEDQDYELAEITQQFGPRVGEMVDILSERKRNDRGERRPWVVRKRETIERMETASRETMAVKAADTLHNAHSFSEDLRREGAELWRHFNRGPQHQLDYYRSIVELSEKHLGRHPLVEELIGAVDRLAQAIDETAS